MAGIHSGSGKILASLIGFAGVVLGFAGISWVAMLIAGTRIQIGLGYWGPLLLALALGQVGIAVSQPTRVRRTVWIRILSVSGIVVVCSETFFSELVALLLIGESTRYMMTALDVLFCLLLSRLLFTKLTRQISA